MYLNIETIKEYLIRNKKFRIVFLGDSITLTEWVHPNWREIVEYVVKEELKKVISDWRIPSWQIRGINCGFDGGTTKNILEKIKEGEIDIIHPNMLGNAYIAKILLGNIFGIKFDPEKYLGTLLAGEKYPKY